MVVTKSIKTIELKAVPTSDQIEYIDNCLRLLKTVWNVGLSRLIEFDTFKKWRGDKDGSGYYPCCPMNWRFRTCYLDENDCVVRHPTDEQKATLNKINVPYSPRIDEQSRWYIKKMARVRIPTPMEQRDSWGWKLSEGCNGFSCPIKQDYREPLISSSRSQAKGGLGLVIKEENLDNFPFLLDVPYKFRAGTIASLSLSWEEYLKTRFKKAKVARGMPRFKTRKDDLTSLVHPNPKEVVRPDPKQPNTLLGVPGMKQLKVQGLWRWKNLDGSTPLVQIFKIVKRASGYYVQLTGEIEYNLKVKPSDKAVGLDPGLHSLLTSDGGKKVSPPKFLRKSEDKLRRLQKKLARKVGKRILIWLNDANRTVEEVRTICPQISKVNAIALLEARSLKKEQHAIDIIGSSCFNTLKYHLESNREKRLKQQVSVLHEKVAARRHSHQHKLSTYIVRSHGKIAVESMSLQKLIRRELPKEHEEGKCYLPNGQKKKGRMNKSFSDAAIGSLISKIETKAKVADREFKRIDAKDTTQKCPVCDFRQQVALGERYVTCGQCGFAGDRDQRAAINILSDANFKNVRFSQPAQDVFKLRQEVGDKYKKSKNRRKPKQNEGLSG